MRSSIVQLRVIDIRTTGLVEALGSIVNLVVWEALRRFGRGATMKEIALQVGQSLDSVNKSHSALEVVGLVSWIRATRANRVPKWTVIGDSIVVAFSPYDPIDEALKAEMTELFGPSRVQEIRRMTNSPHG